MIKNEFEYRQDLFDLPAKHFLEHLVRQNNNRILFSGKFGIGQSFFLDHFFNPNVQVQTMRTQNTSRGSSCQFFCTEGQQPSIRLGFALNSDKKILIKSTSYFGK